MDDLSIGQKPDTSPDLEEEARIDQLISEKWQDGNDIDAIIREVGKVARRTEVSRQRVRSVAVERGLATWEGDDLRIPLADVGADCQGRTFLFDVEILSISDVKTLPKKIKARCIRCIEYENSVEVDIKSDEIFRLALLSPKERMNAIGMSAHNILHDAVCNHPFNSTKIKTEEIKAVDFRTLRCGDIHDDKQFAERKDDIRLDIYFIGINPPNGGRIRVRGKILPHPITRNLIILAEDFKELEDRPVSQPLDEQRIAAFRQIGQMPTKELRLQICPDMVGRPLLQESRILVLCSPMRIPDIMGREIRGSLIEALIGDTKCNKTESAVDTALHQKLGFFVQAENARRTGLTYSITRNESTGEYILNWGVFPRNHGTYGVIDGLEKYSSEEQSQFRAVMDRQYVAADQVVSGRRPAAVRLTITCNPRKPVRSYPFRCMAIPDSRPFADGPDISRVDIWHVVGKEDVSKTDLAGRKEAKRPLDDEVFKGFNGWCWTRNCSDIEYTDEADAIIIDESARIMQEYGSASLPIVHDGFRDLLCRVSVAVACRHFSSPDGIRVIVTENHVREAADFLERTYEALQLRKFREHVEEGAILDGGQFLRTAIEIGRNAILVLNCLAKGKASAREVAEQLGGEVGGWGEKDVHYQYRTLKEHRLVETRSGLGSCLTSKGVRFYKGFLAIEREFSQESGRIVESDSPLPSLDGLLLPKKWEKSDSSLKKVGEEAPEGDG